MHLRALHAIAHNCLTMQVFRLSPHDKFIKRIPLYFFDLPPRPRFVVWPSGKKIPFLLSDGSVHKVHR